MHRDHDIFVQAIKDKRKVLLTFFSDEYGSFQTRLCIPMDYSPRDVAEEKSGHYYFWDFEQGTNGSPLILLPNKIVSMEPTEEHFDAAEFVTWNVKEFPWFLERDWG